MADRDGKGWTVEHDDSYAQTGYNPGDLTPRGTTGAMLATGVRFLPTGAFEEQP